MKPVDKQIFESLIADTQFIRWAKGEWVDDPHKWEEWKKVRPGKGRTFDEACQTVRIFSFAKPEISNLEVEYLKQKTFERSKSQKNKSLPVIMLHNLMRVAAVLFIPLLLFTTWTWLDKNKLQTTYTSLVEDKFEQEITVVAPIGTQTIVELPDGSKVWLNAGSRLIYPPIFSKSARNVRLEGEAFFEINKRDQPFRVDNFGPSIKVYGTQFNVNAYEEEEQVTVALVEGSIALEGQDEELFMKPGEVSFFDKQNQKIVIENDRLEEYVCWREGKYIFRNSSLNAILRVLQRQHNVEFLLADPKLGGYQYNATFQNESLEQILQLLELSAPIQFDYTKGYFDKNGTYVKGNVKIHASYI